MYLSESDIDYVLITENFVKLIHASNIDFYLFFKHESYDEVVQYR